jgi:AraC-like DNA-binding protein
MDADMSVVELANRAGLTPRKVHRHCVDAFGLAPSVLRRIARVQRAARLHRGSGASHSLVDLALAAGFADQAHLSREIKALTGLTPSVALS